MPASPGSNPLVQNPVINGGMQIAQTGGTGNLPANALAHTELDMWDLDGVSNGGILDIDQAGNALAAPFQKLRVRVVTADAILNPTQTTQIQTAIEGYNARSFFAVPSVNFRPFTVNFVARSSLPGIYSFSITNLTRTRCFAVEYVITAPNQYQNFSIPINGNGDLTGVWSNTDSATLILQWGLTAGSIRVSTPALMGQWQDTTATGTVLFSPNQVNFLANVNNEFQLANVSINPGVLPTPYIPQLFMDELARCQRYYWQTFPYGTFPVAASGDSTGAFKFRKLVAGATNEGVGITYPVAMRIPPIVTGFNTQNNNALWHNQTLGADSGALITSNNGEIYTFVENAAVAGDGVGDSMFIHATFDARM